MKCPECRSTNVDETGEDDLGNLEFECMSCGHQFDSTGVDA